MTTITQYKKISPAYRAYNPNGKTYFSVQECDCCGILYIEEVGIARKDENLGEDESFVKISGHEWFTVYGKTKGLCKTLKGAQKRLNEMLKERSANDDNVVSSI